MFYLQQLTRKQSDNSKILIFIFQANLLQKSDKPSRYLCDEFFTGYNKYPIWTVTAKYNIEFPLNGVNLVKINKEILIKMDLDSD